MDNWLLLLEKVAHYDRRVFNPTPHATKPVIYNCLDQAQKDILHASSNKMAPTEVTVKHHAIPVQL
jgi:hypothetical protein